MLRGVQAGRNRVLQPKDARPHPSTRTQGGLHVAHIRTQRLSYLIGMHACEACPPVPVPVPAFTLQLYAACPPPPYRPHRPPRHNPNRALHPLSRPTRYPLSAVRSSRPLAVFATSGKWWPHGEHTCACRCALRRGAKTVYRSSQQQLCPMRDAVAVHVLASMRPRLL